MPIPSNVTGVRVMSLDVDNAFSVTWNASPTVDGVTQYNVYRSEISTDGYSMLATVSVGFLQCVDNNIPFSFDKLWFYKVTAVNSLGESDPNAVQGYTDYNYLAFAETPVKLDYRAKLIDWIENETPSGTIDGTNNIFYTNYNFKPNTLQVFIIGGQKLLARDFSCLTPNSFSINVTPTIGNVLSVNYILQSTH